MKRFILITIFLLSTSVAFAQKDTTFYKHEVRASVGDAFWAQVFWTSNTWSSSRQNASLYANISFSYFYRPVKWFWVGGNFIHYFGEKIYYNWREYSVDGNYRDFSRSKPKYCVVIAPEIRFSFFNHKAVILYSALSGGVCFENGYTTNRYKYPEIHCYYHLTYFGFSCNFGKKNNIFLGGELGIGFKGLGSIHGGYRF